MSSYFGDGKYPNKSRSHDNEAGRNPQQHQTPNSTRTHKKALPFRCRVSPPPTAPEFPPPMPASRPPPGSPLRAEGPSPSSSPQGSRSFSGSAPPPPHTSRPLLRWFQSSEVFSPTRRQGGSGATLIPPSGETTSRAKPQVLVPPWAGRGMRRIGQRVLASVVVLTRRKPWLSLRLEGSFLLRYAPRKFDA